MSSLFRHPTPSPYPSPLHTHAYSLTNTHVNTSTKPLPFCPSSTNRQPCCCWEKPASPRLEKLQHGYNVPLGQGNPAVKYQIPEMQPSVAAGEPPVSLSSPFRNNLTSRRIRTTLEFVKTFLSPGWLPTRLYPVVSATADGDLPAPLLSMFQRGACKRVGSTCNKQCDRKLALLSSVSLSVLLTTSGHPVCLPADRPVRQADGSNSQALRRMGGPEHLK